MTPDPDQGLLAWENAALRQRVEELEARLELEASRRFAAPGAPLSERQLRLTQQIVEGSPGLVSLKDRNGVYREVNDGFCQWISRERAQILGCTDFDLFPLAQATLFREEDRLVLESGRSAEFERKAECPNGTRWHRILKAPFPDSAGLPSGVLCTALDITALKRSDDALMHSRDLMRFVIEHMHGAIAVHGRDLRYLYVSERYLSDYSVQEKDIIGKHHYDVFPDLPQKWRDVHQRALAGEVSRCDEDSFERADGGVLWTRWECRPWFEAGGAIGGIVIYTEVITERKLATDALRESERFHRAVLEGSMDGYWRLDTSLRVLEVNQAACRMSGYTEAELLKMRAPDMDAVERPEEPGLRAERMKRFGGDRFETYHRRKDGSVFPVEVSLQRTAGPKPQIVAFVRDISARRRTQDELAKSQEVMSVAQRAAGFAVFQWEVASGKTYWSREAYALWGLAETVEPSPESFLEVVFPEDRERLREEVAAAFGGGATGLNVEYRVHDGSRWMACVGQVFRGPDGAAERVVGIHIDVTARKKAEQDLALLAAAIEQAHETVVVTGTDGNILYANPAFERTTGYAVREALGRNPRLLKSGAHEAEFYRAMWDELARGNVWRGRFQNRRKDGSLYLEEATISPVRDAHGRIASYIAVKLDVTREAALGDQLFQSQKLESIGRLAGGVAHDFNNLLTVINGYSRLTLSGLRPNDPLRAPLEEIRKAGERAAGLTRQLLAFSRKQILQPHPLDLNAALRDMRGMLERLVGEDIQVFLALDVDPVPVLADPNQLEQVILNLTVNARDAMPRGGMLSFETGFVERGEDYAALRPDVRPGRYAALTVSDTGVGMDDATRQRVFEPFFTTKGPGEGTGLGLATVQGIVAQSGGHLEVRSAPGQGSVFHICLPALEGALDEQAEETQLAPGGGAESILVVEDQAEVGAFVTAALSARGYRATLAGGAREALEIFRRAPESFDLVLTDLVMPGMGGRELVRRLEAMRPGMKSLFMSGYAGPVEPVAGGAGSMAVVISKPFTPEELLRQVRAALGPAVAPLANLLVVDDEAGVRGFLKATLEQAGYGVVEAGDGRQAIEVARRERVDLVILDLVMPEQEGIETMQILRQEQPDAAVIAISGAFGGRYLGVARMLGARAVLAKPIHADSLLEAVAAALAR